MGKTFVLESLSTEQEVRAHLLKRIPPNAGWIQIKETLKDEGLEFGETKQSYWAVYRSKKSGVFAGPVRRDWKVDFEFQDLKLRQLRVTKWLTGT